MMLIKASVAPYFIKQRTEVLKSKLRLCETDEKLHSNILYKVSAIQFALRFTYARLIGTKCIPFDIMN